MVFRRQLRRILSMMSIIIDCIGSCNIRIIWLRRRRRWLSLWKIRWWIRLQQLRRTWTVALVMMILSSRRVLFRWRLSVMTFIRIMESISLLRICWIVWTLLLSVLLVVLTLLELVIWKGDRLVLISVMVLLLRVLRLLVYNWRSWLTMLRLLQNYSILILKRMMMETKWNDFYLLYFTHLSIFSFLYYYIYYIFTPFSWPLPFWYQSFVFLIVIVLIPDQDQFLW
jgi:hypothetical protein